MSNQGNNPTSNQTSPPSGGNENKSLITISVVLLVVVVAIFLMYPFVAQPFESSVEINGIIASVLLGSFIIVFISTYFDSKVVKNFKKNIYSPDESLVSGGVPFLSILVKMQDGIGVHDNEINKACAQELGKGLNYVGFFTGAMVTLGLIGTFIGLSSAVTDIGRLVSALGGEGDAYEKVTKLFSSLAAPLEGMGTAFGTSLIGVLSSLISGAVNTLYTYTVAQNTTAIKAEIYIYQRANQIVIESEVIGGGSGGPGVPGIGQGGGVLVRPKEIEVDDDFVSAVEKLQNIVIEQRKHMDSLLAEHRTGMKVLLDQVESKRKINAAIAMNMESMTDSLTMQMTLMQEVSTVGRHNNERLHALVSILEEFSTNYAERLARMLPNVQRLADDMDEQLHHMSDLAEIRKIAEQQSRRMSDLGAMKTMLEDQNSKLSVLDRNQTERLRDIDEGHAKNMERIEGSLNTQIAKINEISEEFGTLVKIKYIAEQQLRKFSEMTGKRLDNNVEVNHTINRVENTLSQVDSKLTGLSKILLDD